MFLTFKIPNFPNFHSYSEKKNKTKQKEDVKIILSFKEKLIILGIGPNSTNIKHCHNSINDLR